MYGPNTRHHVESVQFSRPGLTNPVTMARALVVLVVAALASSIAFDGVKGVSLRGKETERVESMLKSHQLSEHGLKTGVLSRKAFIAKGVLKAFGAQPWFETFHPDQPLTDDQKYPIIFTPGICSSRLKTEAIAGNDSDQLHGLPQGVFTKIMDSCRGTYLGGVADPPGETHASVEPQTLWFPDGLFGILKLVVATDCALFFLKQRVVRDGNGELHVTESVPLVSVDPIKSNHGLDGVSCLSGGEMCEGSYAYLPLIKTVESWGYTAGQDLFGLPYDWRRLPKDNKACEDLEATITKAKRTSGKNKVQLVGHSMGNLVLQTCLTQRPQLRQSVHGFLSIAAPWAGSSVAFKMMSVGHIFVPILSYPQHVDLAGRLPTAYWLLPTGEDGGIPDWVEFKYEDGTKPERFSSKHTRQLFSRVFGAQSHHLDFLEYAGGDYGYRNLQDPGVPVTCIGGRGQVVPQKMDVTLKQANQGALHEDMIDAFNDGRINFRSVDGDGVVPVESALALCHKFDRTHSGHTKSILFERPPIYKPKKVFGMIANLFVNQGDDAVNDEALYHRSLVADRRVAKELYEMLRTDYVDMDSSADASGSSADSSSDASGDSRDENSEVTIERAHVGDIPHPDCGAGEDNYDVKGFTVCLREGEARDIARKIKLDPALRKSQSASRSAPRPSNPKPNHGAPDQDQDDGGHDSSADVAASSGDVEGSGNKKLGTSEPMDKATKRSNHGASDSDDDSQS